MSENLMRVEMSYGYDCKRVVDVTRYADDLTPDGRAFRDPAKRNRMSEIGLGEIWVSYDDNGLTPTFKANVIVNDTGERAGLYDTMVKMAATVKRIMEVSAKEFAGRVDGISLTGDEAKADVEQAIADKAPGGRVKVDIPSFAGRIMKRAFDMGCVMSNQYKVDVAKWKSYFERNLTHDMIVGILRTSPVVKCVGDFADFENQEALENVESKFSLKIASDAIIKMTSEMQN